ncbi:MAG: TadE/TadG family type IV pilus assembly protein [Alphaproteobacteria bacterium]
MPGKFIKKWLGKEDGTTSIEFSMLFIPYLMLSLGIIELSIMYASASLLEGATGSAARLIRTGQIQQETTIAPEDMFRNALCDYTTALISCGDIVVEVVPLNSFNDYAAAPAVFDEDGNMVPQGFDAGGSNDRILVRVAYRYTMMTPFIGHLLAGPDNSRLFMSTIVLQTEPYEFSGNV